MKIAIILASMLLPSIALAQAAQPSPSEQALGAKLMREINDGLACSSNVVTLQTEVQRLQTKLKEAEKDKPAGSK